MNKKYWLIGKRIFALKNRCSNPCEYISNYYSYLYGNSYMFSRENVIYMKKLYLFYPIYFNIFDKISWDIFKLLLSINSNKVRNFYLNILLFCNSSYEELSLLIDNYIYFRI